MADRRQGTPAKGDRDARLKAALKANIARRKARAQALEETSGGLPHSPDGGGPRPPSEKD
jgi:hypothetical protein